MSTKTLLNPFFGEYGGMYVPQILVPALLQLEEAFVKYKDDPTFKQELNDLLYNYAGRPTVPQYHQRYQNQNLPEA